LIEVLRLRFLPVMGVFLAIVILSPTPVNRLAVSHIDSARIAAISGSSEAALGHLEALLEIYPDNARFHLSAAEIALSIGSYDRVLLHLDALKGKVDEDRDLLCIQADLLIHQGEYEKALERWEFAERDCPGFEYQLRPVADQLLDEGMFEDAEDILITLSQLLPTDSEIQLQLGFIIASHDPENALASLRLADDLSENGCLEARELYRVIDDALIEDHPAYTLASAGQFFVAHGYWSFAMRAFEKVVTIQPDYAEAFAYLGLSQDKNGLSGLENLETAVALAPDQLIPHLFLGIHWLEKDEIDLALEELNKAIEIDPQNPTVIAQIGEAYNARGDPAIAIDAYRIAAELNPQDPTFWLLLAQMSLKNEYQVSQVGLLAARNAVALDTNSAAALDALGYAYFLLGDLNFAERFITRALQKEPLLPLTQYHFGLLKATQNDVASAIAAFQFARILDGDGSVGHLAGRALETIAP
jgi:tetratricopeptide (TPR) repeat protein